VVEDLEFRVVPRRREPQRAITLNEAEAIADPVMRSIYLASKKRVNA
jgi:hypothetical protein